MTHLRVRFLHGGLLVASMLATPGCDGDESDLAGDELASTGTDESESSDTGNTAETSGDASESSDTTETTTETTTDTTETTTDTTGESLSFAADVYPIIMAECSCHVANAPGQLPMPNAATAYANLVDVPSVQVGLDRVEPSDPDSSHLFKKITATQTFGMPMPTTPPLLGVDDVTVFEEWIASGAPE